MHHLFRDSRRVMSIVIGLVSVAAVTVGAQAQKAVAAKPSSTPTKPALPRAPDGHPDLDGIWDFTQLTPFERPGNFAGKSRSPTTKRKNSRRSDSKPATRIAATAARPPTSSARITTSGGTSGRASRNNPPWSWIRRTAASLR